MKYKRILIFSTDDHLYPAGGAEQAMGNITERMPEITFDLICAKLRRRVKRYEQAGNVHIYRVGLGIPKVDGIILALFGHLVAYRLMRKHTYDLVWSIMASYGAFSAVRVKKKTGIPFLLTLQEGDSLEHIYKQVRFVRGQFNEIFSSADGIQAISNYLLNWGKDMGFQGTRAEVIPNGVNMEAFTQKVHHETLASVRSSFGFPPHATILMTSSRLEKKNGVGDVVAALPLLPENVCFVICGSGSLETTIRAQVETLCLGARVRFMGFVDPKELPILMQASDIFIRPSLTEGLGNAFLEAMAARTIVIGTPAGGIPDFLTDGETGYMVDIEDPESIAKAVQRIITLPHHERLRILDRAEHMVRERYSWDLVSKEMLRMFNDLTP